MRREFIPLTTLVSVRVGSNVMICHSCLVWKPSCQGMLIDPQPITLGGRYEKHSSFLWNRSCISGSAVASIGIWQPNSPHRREVTSGQDHQWRTDESRHGGKSDLAQRSGSEGNVVPLQR